MSVNVLNPGAGDPMCGWCRCLVTDPRDRVMTNGGAMHRDCRAGAYRDVACRTLDKAEAYARSGAPLPADEIEAMTARIADLNRPNPLDEPPECHRGDSST